MPLIPLITQSNPLPNTPAPVMDKQRRPAVDDSGIIKGNAELANAQQKPLLPAEKLAAPYEALGTVGKAIEQSGSVVGALALKMKEAQTDTQVADYDGKMDSARADFEAWKTTNPDPADWQQEWQKRVGTLRTQFGADTKLNTGARQQIDLRLTRYQGQSSADVMAGAAKETFARAKSTYLATVSQAIDTQNKGRFEEAVATGEQKGYFYPHESESLRQRFTQEGLVKAKQAEADAVNSGRNVVIASTLSDGPEAAMKKLDDGEYGKFEPQIAEQFRSIIKETARSRQGEIADDVANKIATGELSNEKAAEAYFSQPERAVFASPAFQAKVKEEINRDNDLDQRHAEELDRQQNGAKNFAEQYAKISAFDRSEFGKDEEAQLAAFQLRLETKRKVGAQDDGFLQKLLWEKTNAQLQQGQTTKDLVNEGIKAAFNPVNGLAPFMVPETKTVTHLFGKDTQKPVLKSNGKPNLVLDPGKQRAAQVAIAYTKQRMDEWAKAHPQDANDPAKVNEALNKALPEGLTGSVFMRMQQKAASPPQASTGGELHGFVAAPDLQDKLPAGLKPHAKDFLDAAREYGLNPRALAAISALETAGGTSKAFREKQNAMGISDDSGPKAMASVRDSIFHMAKTLANTKGPYAKAKTLDEIGRIYAPPGASNDFNGTNAGWSEGVRAYLSRL